MATAALFLEACGRLPGELRAALQSRGLLRAQVIARLFTDDEIADGELGRYLATLLPGTDADLLDDYQAMVLEVAHVAGLEAKRQRGVVAHAPMEDITVQAEKARRIEYDRKYEGKFKRADLESARARVPPTPPRYVGPSISRAAAAHDGDPRGRANAEAAARSKVIDDLVSILHAGGHGDAGRLRLAAGGRRVRTLKKRVNAWRAFQRWMVSSGGNPGSLSLEDWMDYLACRAEEPCGRTVLDNIFALYKFMEDALGLQGEARNTESPVMVNALKELKLFVAMHGAETGHGQAVRPPLMLMRLLEEFVMNVEADQYDRGLAWWMLASSWGVARFDDHRGLDPSTITIRDGALCGVMTRTKTTGSDKTVKVREFHIGAESYLHHREWLTTGWSLWSDWGEMRRDYFLLSRAPGGGARHRELGYEEYIGGIRRIIAGLTFGTDSHEVLGAHFAMVMSAHSWRAFLPSAAAALHAPPHLLDALGAWRPKGGAVYARTIGLQALEVQRAVAERVRSAADDVDVVGEAADILDIKGRMLKRGADASEAAAIATLMSRGTQQSSAPPPWKELLPSAPVVEECREGAADKPSSSSSSVPATLRAEQARVPREAMGYVVSLVKKGKATIRRLHFVGLCHLVPGIDYLRFEEHGRTLPTEEQYDSVCSRCWPKGIPERNAESEGTDGSSTPSSGSDGE